MNIEIILHSPKSPPFRTVPAVSNHIPVKGCFPYVYGASAGTVLNSGVNRYDTPRIITENGFSLPRKPPRGVSPIMASGSGHRRQTPFFAVGSAAAPLATLFAHEPRRLKTR